LWKVKNKFIAKSIVFSFNRKSTLGIAIAQVAIALVLFTYMCFFPLSPTRPLSDLTINMNNKAGVL